MKRYLVTGASSGIGLATAKMLIESGNFVYGTYFSNKQIVKTLEGSINNIKMLQVDLTSYQSISDLAKQLVDIQLDGIVNSAGVFSEISFEQFDIEAFEKNFKINTFAPVYLVSLLQHNLNDKASIVNVSSTDAMVGSNAGMGYSASKAALSNISLGLANTLAHRNIRVNAVAPGWIGSGMDSPQQLLDIAADFNPLKRVGTYEEIANVICFLLSDKASYINGTIVVADGGDMSKNFVLEQETKIYKPTI